MFSVAIIVITAAIFLAMIINLAAKPDITAKITKLLLIVAVAGGLIFYGYGYSSVIADPFLATIRALLSVCGMFVGKSDISAIAGAPLLSYTWALILFWLIHLAALYTSASAAITTVGAEALKKLRIAMARRGELILIYGTNSGALDFGRECAAKKGTSVLFVSEKPTGGSVTAIAEMGAAFRSDETAVNPNRKFIKSIGMNKGGRHMNVYCMESDDVSNYTYAAALRSALSESGISSDQVSLVIRSDDQAMAASLQAYRDTYGFGNVTAFRIQDQAARLAIKKCPPWECIRFDENGRALDNFEALLIGFGSFGQSLLKYLVMNGQFYGSHFKLTIISPDCGSVAGYVKAECPGIFENYDINMIDADARSLATFTFIDENIKKLKYIAVSIGNEKDSKEVSGQLRAFLRRIRSDIPVIQCSANGIYYKKPGKAEVEKSSLYTSEMLDYRTADLYAMALNHKYSSDPDSTMWEDWLGCDHFGRMSSRASADFIPAMIRIMNTDAAALENVNELTVSDKTDIQNGTLSVKLAENLGKTEHERWCAFHYANGFAVMEREEWEKRAEVYREEIKESGKAKIRIGKNMDELRHACLIPWDELDELSARENSVTGKTLDYKQMDINNVIEIPVVLKTAVKADKA